MTAEDVSHLLLVPYEVLAEAGPGFQRDGDRVPVGLPDLADLQEDAEAVRAHVEVKALVVDAERRRLGQLGRRVVVPRAGLVIAVVVD